ncbi:MAG TPA: sporadic carbohydrate cluster 2OG-Fe(II) oxygenase [Hyphomicrobiaceae bacterium]|nr:sporadic carbohydrate cluster 2OG-Fe(II) oxygenase [Hyphomicrobiaceae bacterium]
MALVETFHLAEESALAQEFLANGYVVRDVEDRAALDALRRETVRIAARLAEARPPADDGTFLDQLHRTVPIEKLNSVRLGIYRELNDKAWFRPTAFKLARRLVETLVGNELAMQNRINVSIQMPHDKTSLLDIHADAFSGETPYQVVQWLPLVDVAGTKSMFILPRPKSEAAIARMSELGSGGMRALFEAVKGNLVWLTINYGEQLMFCPNLLHGNVVNEEETTRVSLNVRYKGLFTPYVSAEKSLGAFYLPITTRPATRLGMAYRNPDGFSE